jgi:L-lactate dehydrogenase (cytochrome)
VVLDYVLRFIVATMPKSISVQEVQKHASDDDLWLVVDGNVYDLTEFAPEHPGGIDSK